MEMDTQPATDGEKPPAARRMKPLSVEEALPYTPLGSIVPFPTDAIPFPHSRSARYSTIFSDENSRSEARQSLEALNAAVDDPAAAKYIERTTAALRKDMALSNTTEIKFKHAPGFHRRTSKAPATGKRPDRKLGKYAENFLKEVPATYSAHEQIKASELAEKGKDGTKKSPAKKKTVTDKSKPPTPSKPKQSGTPKKATKIKTEMEGLVDTNMQTRADDALASLRDGLRDIFEAQDRLQLDTSGVVSNEPNGFFEPSDLDDGSHQVLTVEALSMLDGLIKKASSLHTFVKVPKDEVSRLQKICDSTLRNTELVEIKIRPGMSEADVESWAVNIQRASKALKCSRTTMLVLVNSSEEMHTFSEETFNNIMSITKAVLEECIIPSIELRGSGSSSETYDLLANYKQELSAILQDTRLVLRSMAKLVLIREIAESSIISMEFLALSLIVMESGTDKDSLIAVQKVERLRVCAMEILENVFARYPDQRQSIIGEVLTSLEKLPVTRQSARQFKLAEGKNIQLVSALLMGLVQSSATKGSAQPRKEFKKSEPSTPAAEPEPQQDVQMQVDGESKSDQSLNNLIDASRELYDAANKNAQYVIQFLVTRAMNSTKTGDAPYRNLLDIFTEDFISVLTMPEWPAAELLLRCLLSHLLTLAEGDKSSSLAKNMALDLMGLMGSAISDIKMHMTQACKGFAEGKDELANTLNQLTQIYLNGNITENQLIAWDGPYRVALEYLGAEGAREGTFSTAAGFVLSQWCARVVGTSEQDEQAGSFKHSVLAFQLRQIVLNPKTLTVDYEFADVKPLQAKLAYDLLVLNMPFGKAFERILVILLQSMNSDQATVRSKSMKSVIQLIEKDPGILDRGTHVMRHILKRATDPSPLVRDSTIGLLGKCMGLRPELESQICVVVLERSDDSAPLVRKRAMKLLKDVYLRNDAHHVKSHIADALLRRVQDPDQSVSELARSTLEEIWIAPYHGMKSLESLSTESKLRLKAGIDVIVKTVQTGEAAATVLTTLLQTVLAKNAKNSAANINVSRIMVAQIFDDILETPDDSEQSKRHNYLQTLTVFAKASPSLFNGDQLELLQPYIENLSSGDDLQIYRSVIVIFRCVLPQLASLQKPFLLAVQNSLMSSLSKLGKRELNEVVQCLWAISKKLHSTDRLITVTISCCKQAYSLSQAELAGDGQGAANAAKLVRYMNIAGHLGKHCDFERNLKAFKAAFVWWKGNSPSALMIDILAPFTSTKKPLIVRKSALENIGNVCQKHARNFLREQVYSAFDVVFAEKNPELEAIVLQNFKEFMALEEKRSDKSEAVENGGTDRRLDGHVAANQNDGGASSIAQRYLKDITRLALTSQNLTAVLATEVIGSINRQGLVIPGECGPALVALQTSTNDVIAQIAFKEGQMMHQKYETLVEREYLKGVEMAYTYQCEVIGDNKGVRNGMPKLEKLFEILKISKGKSRRKFLSNLASKIKFDASKLDVSTELPPQLVFARFILENVAFFDYSLFDEVLHIVHALERLVADDGTGLALVLEAEVLKTAASMQNGDSNGVSHAAPATGTRLRQLGVASTILTIVWQTRAFLRRLYSVNAAAQKAKEAKAKAGAANKDVNRPATKSPNAGPDKFLEEMEEALASLDQETTLFEQCQKFVELMSIDSELKGAGDSDSMDEDGGSGAVPTRSGTPMEDDKTTTPRSGTPNTATSRKRKSDSQTPGNKKRRNISESPSKQRMVEISVDEEDGEGEIDTGYVGNGWT